MVLTHTHMSDQSDFRLIKENNRRLPQTGTCYENKYCCLGDPLNDQLCEESNCLTGSQCQISDNPQNYFKCSEQLTITKDESVNLYLSQTSDSIYNLQNYFTLNRPDICKIDYVYRTYVEGVDHSNCQSASYTMQGTFTIKPNDCSVGRSLYKHTIRLKKGLIEKSFNFEIKINEDHCTIATYTPNIMPPELIYTQWESAFTSEVNLKIPLSSFFNYGGTCRLSDCKIKKLESSCSLSNQQALRAETLDDQQISMVIDTSTPGTIDVCMRCKTNDMNPREFFSNSFTVRINQYDCSKHFSLKTIPSTIYYTIPAVNTGDQTMNVVMKGGDYVQDFVSKCISEMKLAQFDQNQQIDTIGGIQQDKTKGEFSMLENVPVRIEGIFLILISADRQITKLSNMFSLELKCDFETEYQVVYFYPDTNSRIQGVYITQSSQGFLLQNYTNLQTKCPIDKITLTSNNDGIETGNHIIPDQIFLQTSYNPYNSQGNLVNLGFMLKPDKIDVKAKYNFYFYVTFVCGSQTYIRHSISQEQMFTFQVVCGESSTSITEPVLNPTLFEQMQQADRGNGFEIPMYSSTESQCPIVKVEAIEQFNNIPFHALLEESSQFSLSMVKIKPQNDSLDAEYRFKVKFTAEGGHSFVSTQSFTYFHGCPVPVIHYVQNPNFTQFVQYEILQSPEEVYIIQPPSIWPSYCKVREYQVEREQIDGVPVFDYISRAKSCDKKLDCSKLSLNIFLTRYTLSFRIRIKIGQVFETLSSQVRISVGCLSNSAIISSNLQQQVFSAKQYSKLIIPLSNFNFGCYPKACCEDLKFEVSHVTNIPRGPINNPKHIVSQPFAEPESNELKIDVFTGEMGQTNFTVSCQNKFGTKAVSQVVIINITYNCEMDTFEPNITSPSASEINNNSYPVEAYFKDDPEANFPYFWVNVSVGSYKQIQFSITNRVVNNASEYCRLQNFTVGAVTDLDAQQTLESKRYQLFVDLTPTGVFKLMQVNVLKNMTIFVNATNGLRNLTMTKPLLGYTVFQPPMNPPKQAPFFEQPITYSEIFLTDEMKGKKHIIQLPNILNGSKNAKITIELTPAVNYISLDQNKRQIVIDLSKAPSSSNKMNLFTLKLTDQDQAQRTYAIPIQFIAPKNTISSKNDSSQTIITKQHSQIVKASIESLSQSGLLTIRFSEIMKTQGLNLTFFNSSVFDMYVQPFENWHRDIFQFNLSQLNFTWSVLSFEGHRMEIQLKFNNPLEVSPKAKQDLLVWHLVQSEVNKHLLVSEEFETPLNIQYYTLQTQIKKQVLDNQVAELTKMLSIQAEKTLNGVMMASTVLNLFFSGFMSYLFSVMNSLQLVLHLPIFNVVVPANVSQIFSILIPIFMYDVLGTYLIEPLQKIWPQQDPASFKSSIQLDQMSDIGYSSYNPVINLGTLCFLLLMYLLKVLITIMLLWPISMCSQSVKRLFVKSWNAVFFGEFFIIFIEGYLEFLIASFLVYQAPVESPDRSPFLLGFGIACFTITNGVVPLVIIYHLTFYSIEQLRGEGFHQKWGVLYERVNKKDKVNMAFSIVFILRRMVYVWVAIWVINLPGIQIILLNLSNLLVQIFQGTEPLKSSLMNRKENINNFFIVVNTYVFMTFSDWGPDDQEIKYFMGWGLLALMLIQLVVQLYYAIVVFGYHLFIYVKKYSRLAKHVWMPKYLKTTQPLPNSRSQAKKIEPFGQEEFVRDHVDNVIQNWIGKQVNEIDMPEVTPRFQLEFDIPRSNMPISQRQQQPDEAFQGREPVKQRNKGKKKKEKEKLQPNSPVNRPEISVLNQFDKQLLKQFKDQTDKILAEFRDAPLPDIATLIKKEKKLKKGKERRPE